MSEEKQQKKNVPELRFPEFEGEWEKCKLGNMFKIIDGDRGKNYPKEEELLSQGHCVFLNAGNITKSGLKLKNMYFITEEKDKLLKNGKVEQGDIIITTRGTVGNLAYINDQIPYRHVRINSGMIILRNPEEGGFIYHLLNSSVLSRYLNKITVQSAQPHLTKNNLEKMVFYSSSNKLEKEKIETFFSKLDQQIELEEKKLALLEEQKKGYMQKIFSQELRFKDENGNDYPEWEEKKLGEIAHITRGLTYKPTDIRPNGIRVLRSSNIIDNKFFLHEDDIFVDEKAVKIPLVNIGDILITAANGSPKLVGKHALIKKIENKSVAGGFMYVLKAENTNFIQTWMNSKEYKRVISKVQGGNGSIGNLSKRDLERGLITIPNFEEQEKIGGFFDKIDKKNSEVQKKIQKLNELKKALLQKMFI